MTTFWLPLAILFGGLVFGLVFGLPMAFTLGGCAIVAAFLFMGPGAVSIAAMSTYGLMLNMVLVALPLFVFMAAVLEKSGIADALYATMHQWMGPLRGGLAMGTVLICTLIAAMSGVAAAAVVTMGLIALPIMLNRGYNKTISIGCILAGGALGPLIPPSASFIVIGMLLRVSVGRLFAGGMVPGLLLSFLYVSYIGIRCYLQPQLGPVIPKEERGSLRRKIVLTRGLILPILLVMGVLGSIFTGVASPTEAAAIGAFGAIVATAINRRLNWPLLKDAAYRTVMVTGMVIWILYGAMAFSAVFIATGGPEFAKEFVLGLEVAPIVIVLFMMVSYFILGCFVDELTMLFLTIPIYLPILLNLGYDPVWFGVIFMVNMQMAYLTPPFGYNLFYMKGVAPPEVSLADIYRSIIPFLVLQWIGLLLVLFFPQLVLWLPSVVFGLM